MPEPHDATWHRWDEVDALLERALDLAEPERSGFLREACGDDRELLGTLTTLLRASVCGPRDKRPGKGILRVALTEPPASGIEALVPGDRVGRYRILEEIARGGMATVYAAERADGAFERRVAVKVLRRGLDTEELVRRFLAERQILSALAHPNIATMLDGGATDDGRPFLVMELVEGETLTTWADGRKLSVAERVELFAQVVDAVGFAHAHLVVHRDLKPSNVLVTAAGQVKLLDFGVAKLLEPGDGEYNAPLTRVGTAPLTPEFASPEQVRGERVTTSSDVFQLGALLYCLLSGRRPFENGSQRLLGTGLDEVVTPPSGSVDDDGRRRELRGDLDTIVLKSLHPEPAERYGSADALAADLRRHLGGRPILARPASAGYRVKKFVRRNPWFAPLAASVAIVVGVYVGTLLRHSNQLERERNAAQAQAERADALRAFLVGQFEAADPYSDDPGAARNVTVVEAMEAGVRRTRTDLAEQPLLQAEMLSAIAGVYNNLGDWSPALDLVNEAIALRRQHGGDASPDQVEDLGLLGSVLIQQGQRDSARVLLTNRLERERAAFGPDHRRVADALEAVAEVAYVDGEYDRALRSREEALGIRRSVPTDDRALSSLLASLADSYRSMDRWEDAESAAREAHDIARSRLGEEDPTTAQHKAHLAQVLHGKGHLEQAEALYREALPVLERTLGPHHANTLNTWNNLGLVLSEAEDFAGAEDVHRTVLDRRKERHGTDRHFQVASSLQNLASVLLRQGEVTEADSLAREAESIYRSALGDDHYLVAFSLLSQTEAHLRRGRGPAAEEKVRAAIRILEARFGPGSPTASGHCRLGRALALQRRYAEAERILEEALAALQAREGVPDVEIRLCGEGLQHLYELTDRPEMAAALDADLPRD